MKLKNHKSYEDFYTQESNVYTARRYKTNYGKLFVALYQEGLIAALFNKAKPQIKLLEVACGTGQTTEFLQRLGFNITACDLTSAMMTEAQQRTANQSPNVVFLRANAYQLPFLTETFDILVSTRFLHLFPQHQQKYLIQEFARVLKSNGLLVVDMDNAVARTLLAPLILPYNLIRYRRLRANNYYNLPSQAKHLLESNGFQLQTFQGIGGYHLLPLTLLKDELGIKIGRHHFKGFLKYFAEQFLVSAIKK
ncbi:MAG: class I SAM-dependent methyltransferase [Candidatus Competibacteraceae bacterium]